MPLGYRITVVMEVVKRRKKKEEKKKVFFFKKSTVNLGELRLLAFGTWVTTRRKKFKKNFLQKGKVYPRDPQKKMFKENFFFAKKQKLGKKVFWAWPRNCFLSKIIFFEKKQKLGKKCFFQNFLR